FAWNLFAFTAWNCDNLVVELQDAGLDATDWNNADTRDVVDILDWKAKWQCSWLLWLLKLVDCLEQSWTLVPWHLVGLLHDVVARVACDCEELDALSLEADALEKLLKVCLDCIPACFAVIDTADVHLVDRNDELVDTKHLAQEH